MSIECPYCGSDLTEVGVVELVGYVQYPNRSGVIPYEGNTARRLDDTEGYRCVHCCEELDFEEIDDATKIFGIIGG